MAKVLAIIFFLTILTIFNTALFLTYKHNFYDSMHPRDSFTRCSEYFDSAYHNNYTERLCQKYKYRHTLLNLDRSLYVSTYYITNFLASLVIIAISLI